MIINCLLIYFLNSKIINYFLLFKTLHLLFVFYDQQGCVNPDSNQIVLGWILQFSLILCYGLTVVCAIIEKHLKNFGNV